MVGFKLCIIFHNTAAGLGIRSVGDRARTERKHGVVMLGIASVWALRHRPSEDRAEGSGACSVLGRCWLGLGTTLSLFWCFLPVLFFLRVSDLFDFVPTFRMPPRRAGGNGRRGRPRRNPGPLVGGRGDRFEEAEDVSEEEFVPEVQEDAVPQGRQPPPGGYQVPPMAAPAGAAPAFDPNMFIQQMLNIQAQTLQMMQTMQQQTAVRPAPPIQATDYVDLARKHRPPTFAGGSDPIELENWVYKWDQIFEAISCPDDRKMTVAVHYLGEAALHWWRTREHELRVPGFGWIGLTEALKSHFYTPETLNTRKREFLNLRQGKDRSVDQYYERFVELMRYAPETVPTEGEKVRKFLDGLLAELRSRFSYIAFPTLSAAYDAAKFLERGGNDLARFTQGRGRDRGGREDRDRRQGQGPHRGGHRDHHRGPIAVGRGGGQDGARGRYEPYPVREQRQIDRPVRRCWNCNGVGHLQIDCPHPRAQQGQPARGAPAARAAGPVRGGRGGRLNVIDRADAERRDDVLASTIPCVVYAILNFCVIM